MDIHADTAATVGNTAPSYAKVKSGQTLNNEEGKPQRWLQVWTTPNRNK